MKFSDDFFLILVNLQTAIVRGGKQQPGNKTDLANRCFHSGKQHFLAIFLVFYFFIILAISSTISVP